MSDPPSPSDLLPSFSAAVDAASTARAALKAPFGVVISSDTAAAPPLGIDRDSDVLEGDPLDLEMASEPTRPDSVLLPMDTSLRLIGDDEIADGFVIGALRVAKADAAATGQRHSTVVTAVAIVLDLIRLFDVPLSLPPLSLSSAWCPSRQAKRGCHRVEGSTCRFAER